MPSAEQLLQRYESVLQAFEDSRHDISSLRDRALLQLLPELEAELDLEEGEVAKAKAFLDDAGTIYRFLRRARFDQDNALDLLCKTLKWRISSSLDAVSAASLDPLYVDQPLFFFHPRVVDRFGRPCAVLSLRHVKRTADGSLDALKEYIVLGWEVARRYLAELTNKRGEDDPVLQVVVIVDLAGSGMSNMELELMPMMFDLLKSHFPSMVGCLFVLNFGWAYSGMWQVVKRVLPKPALERILFPSKDDLLEFFDESSLLKEHGGTIRYRYAFKGSVFHRLGRPVFASPSPSANASPWQSRTPSRSNSFESLADVYHSTTVSPHSSRPPTPGTGSQRSSANLSMTSLASAVAANAAKTNGRPIKRARSSADFRSHLPERDLALSSSESDISADEAVKARVAKRRGGDSATSSRVHSRAPSRDASPVRSRQSSVSDKPEPTHLSRFSAANPFFGYPAARLSPGSMPQPARRRRKRDLISTLIYLVALRLLALRRTITAEFLAIYEAITIRLRSLGLLPRARKPKITEAEEPQPQRGKRRKAVTFLDIDETEEEVEERRRERRLARASEVRGRKLRPVQPELPRANWSGLKVASVLLCLVLVMRSGRIVCWLKAAPVGSRRAKLKASLRGLVKST